MLLTEKYRPKNLSELVFVNQEYENKFKEWINKKSIDTHLLLYGKPGTGKSSSINVILNELGTKDYIRYNMSDKTSIDDMRKVIDYASSSPLEESFKLVILEEFERASPQAQDSLKYVLDTYSGWCRFIFTTNNISKISLAIQSRCQRFEFNTLKAEDFIKRIVTILEEENISYSDLDIIGKYVQTYYPDLRACINAIDQHTTNNVLQPLFDNDSYSSDKFNEIITKFSKIDILSLKELLVKNVSNEEYELLYQYFYNHLELITNDVNKWDMILVIIAKYLYQHNFVAFADINFVSCLMEIKNILK